MTSKDVEIGDALWVVSKHSFFNRCVGLVSEILETGCILDLGPQEQIWFGLDELEKVEES